MGRGTATEVKICGHMVRLGDWLKVQYTAGDRMKDGTIAGKIIELWDIETDNYL